MHSLVATSAGTERSAAPVEHVSRPRRASARTLWVSDRIPGAEPLELRILALGDCNTSGTTHPADPNPEFCVPSQLAQRLECAGVPCTIQNLGYPMATTREGVARMQRDARDADIVLINFGLVDAWVTSIPAVYIPYYPENFVRKQSRKFLKSLKRRLRSRWARRFIPTGPVVPLPEYLGHVRQLVDMARARSPQACVIVWGTAPTLEESDRPAGIARYNDCLRRLAGELSVPYVDTAQIIDDLDPDAAYRDQTHLNLAATQRVATAMSAAVVKHLACSRAQQRAS